MKNLKILSLITFLLLLSALNYSMANSSETSSKATSSKAISSKFDGEMKIAGATGGGKGGDPLCYFFMYDCELWNGGPPIGYAWCGAGVFDCVISPSSYGYGCI